MFDPDQEADALGEARDFLQNEFGSAPRVAFLLGSGLGAFLENLSIINSRPYRDIPGFPLSTVIGHEGRLVLGEHRNAAFCALQGRKHFYEGEPMTRIVFSCRALAIWGVDTFVVSNAAGAISPDLVPGDLMLITDHINLLGDSPLSGPNLDFLGERFPDMTNAYHPGLRERALQLAGRSKISLKQGVYVAVKGPSYETPAEIRMLREMGADAVGMSTVPEVIALNHMGRRLLGISCITNMAAGVLPGPMRHEDVLQVTKQARDSFSALLTALLGEVQNEDQAN